MRDIITICIGKSVNTFNECLSLLSKESEISPYGVLEGLDYNSQHIKTFFYEEESGIFRPRSLFIDVNSTSNKYCYDNIKYTNKLRNLYTEKNFFYPENQKTNDGNFSNTGTFLKGMKFGELEIENIIKKIQILSRSCTALQGFIIFHNLSNSGSGLSNILCNKLKEVFPRKIILSMLIKNQKQKDKEYQSYNSILHLNSEIKNTDVTCLFSNQKLEKICKEKMNIKNVTFDNYNEIISRVFNEITFSMRFNGNLMVDLAEFTCSGLVPFPSIHFLTLGYSPFNAIDQQKNVFEMTYQTYQKSNIMYDSDPSTEKYMQTLLMFRGNDIYPQTLSGTLIRLKRCKDIQFVDWTGSVFKCGINNVSFKKRENMHFNHLKRSVVSISNSSCIRTFFQNEMNDFNLLYENKSFFHHFKEVEYLITESKENVLSLIRDYNEITEDLSEEEEEEEEGEYDTYNIDSDSGNCFEID